MIESGNINRKYDRLNHDPMLSSAVKSVVRYLKKTLGEDLDGIILYGSYARGEQKEGIVLWEA